MNPFRYRRLRKRGLFPYFDGQKERWGDPFVIWRKLLHESSVDLENITPLVDEAKEPETTQFVEAVASAFGVKRWDAEMETGLMDWEILDLIVGLDEFLAGLKKNSSPGQT